MMRKILRLSLVALLAWGCRDQRLAPVQPAVAAQPIVSLGFLTETGLGGLTFREFVEDPATGNLYGVGSDAVSKQAVIYKLSPAGNVLWAHSLGGNNTTRGYGIDILANGNVVIAGQTGSTTLPTTNGTRKVIGSVPPSECMGSHGCDLDTYAAVYEPDGTRRYSTYVGSNMTDGARGGVAVDRATGAVFIVGFSQSLGGMPGIGVFNDPTKPNYDPSFPNRTTGSGAILTKLSPDLSRVLWTRTMSANGGLRPSYELFSGAVVDSVGNIHLSGIMYGPGAPVTAGGRAHSDGTNNPDLYYAKLDPNGRVIFATYYGGSGNEFAEHRGSLDANGNFYIGGFTRSSNFPTVNPALTSGQGFLVKFNASGSVAFATYTPASTFIMSFKGNTVFGAGYKIEKRSLTPTPNAYQPGNFGSQSAAVLMGFDVSTGQLNYMSYVGGGTVQGRDWSAVGAAKGMTTDANGNPLIYGDGGWVAKFSFTSTTGNSPPGLANPPFGR